jgi:hypothetical protein
MARGQKAVEAKEVEVKAEVKGVVKFEHDNPYLFVPAVDVQFRKGTYETNDEKVIEFLKNVTGVRVVK